MKERDISIDILKFFAVLLITNSHLDLLYGKYAVLATGGALGDAFFFFCSGFTLHVGAEVNFFNWYKKRINRIYPTIFAWAILSAFLFANTRTMNEIITSGGGWFISSIMVYYIFFFFIKKYMANNLMIVLGILLVAAFGCFSCYNHEADFNIYESFLIQILYFICMLMGAIVAEKKETIRFSGIRDLCLLIFFVVGFYAYFYLEHKILFFKEWQIFSFLPLWFIVYYAYKTSNSLLINKIYHHKFWGNMIKLISGLCLEVYVVQFTLIGNYGILRFFPLNIIMMIIFILLAAYVLRCASRIFAQTFKDGDYDWKAIIRLN